MTVAFVTSLRHPDNAADYARIERLLHDTLRSVLSQRDPDFVVIVVGNRRPSVPLDPRVRFVEVDFPPPPAVDGPHASREPFVLDKGSKIGIGLIAAREYAPDWVMIFDADDFVHRDIVGWVHAHPESPGWLIDDGWMYSGRRGAARELTRLYRTCGTCYLLPYSAYRVPDHLTVASTQEEIVAGYGEILPNILGAHRHAVDWHAQRGRVLEPLPFRGAVYHVDTGENHSGKVLTGLAMPLARSVAEEFGMKGRRTSPAAWWRSMGPRALSESAKPLLEGLPEAIRRRAAGAMRRVRRLAGGVLRRGRRALARLRPARAARPLPAAELPPGDIAVLEDIRSRTLAVLERLIGRGADVAILDVPNQRNTGDSLILAGELAYLRALGARIRYMSDLAGFDVERLRRRLPPGGVVLFHGGGNFGDIWSGHQLHRERVAAMLPDRRILVLPQSVYFASRERAAHADRVLSSHPDLTVLVRDRDSAERFASELPSVRSEFCPDAAFGWAPPRVRGGSARDGVLILAREDREAASELVASSGEWVSGVAVTRADWAPTGRPGRRWRAARRIAKSDERRKERGARRYPSGLMSWVYRRISEANIDSARALYRQPRVVVTDRLHAHVLAALQGIPHVVLDNNYGKIGAVLRDYSGAFSTVHRAADTASARTLTEELLDQRPRSSASSR